MPSLAERDLNSVEEDFRFYKVAGKKKIVSVEEDFRFYKVAGKKRLEAAGEHEN